MLIRDPLPFGGCRSEKNQIMNSIMNLVKNSSNYPIRKIKTKHYLVVELRILLWETLVMSICNTSCK